MDQNLAVVGKKIWKIVRVALCMLRKGISKQKIMLDLKLMMKRSKIGCYKAAIQNLLFHFHHTHNRSSDQVNSSKNIPLSPPHDVAYYNHEVTCPNFNIEKHPKSASEEDVIMMHADVMKALEMIKIEKTSSLSLSLSLSSPADNYVRGFGRQLRVTDSPFPDVEETDNHVDEAADEFISKFYRNLRRQSSLSAS